MTDPRNDQPRDRDVIDKLGQDARVLIQARRYPLDRPLTDEDLEQVRLDLRIYIERHKLSLVTIAQEAGVSQSVISQFVSGKYEGDNDKQARILNDWMERHARRMMAQVGGEYVRTQVAEDMRAIINTAVNTCSMAALVTPSGTGKSLVLKVMAEKTRGYYIYCDEDLAPGAFLRQIAATVCTGRAKTKLGSRTRAEISGVIVEQLAGTARPIFLDEAHRLPRDVISRIRSIHDRAEIPIIMAGAAEILDRINDRSSGRGQFASRCIQYNVLEHVLDAESPDGPGGSRVGRPLFTQAEVKAFLDKLDVKLAGDAMMLAWAIACLPNHGCLRTVRRIVLILRPTPESRKKPIDRKEFLKTLRQLFGETGTLIAASANRHAELLREAVA